MRSQFLTLLCILTFFSCAWGLLDAVVAFSQSDAVSQSMRDDRPKPATDKDKLAKKYFEDRTTDDVPDSSDPNQVQSLAVAQFLYALVTLTGAVLMFRLRRIGFWIYVAGVLIGLVLPVLLAGFGALNTSFGVFFSLLFAGMYWTTIKEMH